jgi:hypothetical protein
MMRPNPTKRSVTIIENVMAIVILSIALPPLVGAFADASIQSIHPSNAAVASFLVIDRMEEIVARRYAGQLDSLGPLLQDPGYVAITITNFPDESPVSGFPRFNRRVTVQSVDATLGPVGFESGYRLVRIQVDWDDGNESIFIERVFADFTAP